MYNGKTLHGVLQSSGKSADELVFPEGSCLVILPYGGRILGLFPPDDDTNFFWTHPALNTRRRALDFYNKPDWHNSGGDRCWLAPERELFIANPAKPWDSYKVPAELDPGYYTPEKAQGKYILRNRTTVQLKQLRKSVSVEITRSVSSAPNPVTRQTGLMENSQYAGYTLQSSLRIIQNEKQNNFCLGLWNLLQLPHGGEFIIPTLGEPPASVMFGEIAPDNLKKCGTHIHYRMNASGIQKIGLRALRLLGRAAYRYQINENVHSLVIRNFFINPSGTYVDVPWNNPEEEGFCVQACNVNSELGAFSELEYHVPVQNEPNGEKYCEDQSQIWAFRGPSQSISRIARYLLGKCRYNKSKKLITENQGSNYDRTKKTCFDCRLVRQ